MTPDLVISRRSRIAGRAAWLWGSPAFWRYAELGVSRGSPMVLHTYLLVAYGAAAYAYPAWVMGMVALAAALLPDSQGFLLVRAHGERAWRLARAAVPYVWLKTLLAAAIGGGVSLLWGSETLLGGATPQQLGAVLLAALLYSVTDQLWGFSSQISLARGTLRRVTLTGAAAKAAGLGSIAALHMAGLSSVEADLVAFAAPTLVAAAWTQPGLTSFRRTWRFNRFALTQYALWAQGVSLLTTALSQAIPQGAGLLAGVPASAVGQLAYAFRWLGVGTMMLQVLQGLVTQASLKAFGRARGGYVELVQSARKHPALRPLCLAFRWGGAATAIAGVAGSAIALAFDVITPSVALSMAVYSVGMGLFSAYRFELALAVSRNSAKALLLNGMLPAAGAGSLVTAVAAAQLGLPGLACGVALTWGLFAVCWRRIR